MQLPEERTFDVAVGAPRSGKSTFSAKVIKSYPENALIVKHKANIHDATFSFLPEKTMQNWRQGVPRTGHVKCKMAFMDKDKDYQVFLRWVIDHFRNGLLVIDDATIFEQRETSKLMLEIISMRAHLGIDVLLIFHGFTKMPIDMFTFLNHFIIFNTVDNITRKKDTLTDYDSIYAAVLRARYRYRLYQDRTDPRKYEPEILRIN